MTEETTYGSLRDRIAQRERELAEGLPIVIPIPGYEDLLAVRYHALDYRTMYKIEARHEKNPHPEEGALFAAADKLIQGCDSILEIESDGVYKETGLKWGLQAARDLFGRSLPDETRARAALLAIFRDEMLLVEHAAAYQRASEKARTQIGRTLEGESEASSALT